MNPKLIQARQKKGELTLRAQRPCHLEWTQGGQAKSVCAREGFAKGGSGFMSGGYVDALSCKFYVLRELLDTAPKIDTVFALRDRTQKWRLKEIESGRSASDLLWIFSCVEEHS